MPFPSGSLSQINEVLLYKTSNGTMCSTLGSSDPPTGHLGPWGIGAAYNPNGSCAGNTNFTIEDADQAYNGVGLIRGTAFVSFTS